MTSLPRLLACAAAAILIAIGGAARADPASDFDRFVRQAAVVTAAPQVYLNKYKNGWAKRRFKIVDLKYDVKRTDSLLHPVIGLVDLRLGIDQSAFFATKAEADEAEPGGQLPVSYAIHLNYALSESGWSLKDGEYELLAMPGAGRLPITADRIRAEPNASPFAVLKFWLP